MNATKASRPQICLNVMESLVTEEIEQQLQHFPTQLTWYINKVDVMTYAMNRLPALYASSESGWRHQMSYGKKKLGEQIAVAVRQAFLAVQRNLLRVAIPLEPPEYIEAQAALQKLKDLLQEEQLSWSNLALIVEESLAKASEGSPPGKPKKHLSFSDDYGWDDDGNCS